MVVPKPASAQVNKKMEPHHFSGVSSLKLCQDTAVITVTSLVASTHGNKRQLVFNKAESRVMSNSFCLSQTVIIGKTTWSCSFLNLIFS